MAKKLSKWEKQHLQNINKYLKMLEQIYADAAEEGSIIGAGIRGVNPNKPFSFDDYPSTKKRVDSMLQKMKNSLFVAIINGIRSSWTLANNKNNELCNQVFGDNANDIPEAFVSRYYAPNEEAREAFIKRRENGLNLSDRVWNYTNQYKEEIEYELDEGIREGKSAAEMSRELQDNLKHPNKIFRRQRDENGDLQLSKPAQEFHPGRGVYRSSHKNARRLAATECNMAYREADYERWQQMDFVVGIKIETEGTRDTVDKDGEVIKEGANPTKKAKGTRVADICDDLAGKYPKDFKFLGWHPHCRCHALTILKSLEEMEVDNKRIMNGEEPLPTSASTITAENSDGLRKLDKWLDINKERVARAQENGKLPYFLRDNEKYANYKDVKTGFKGAKNKGKNKGKDNKEDKDSLNISSVEELLKLAKEKNLDFNTPNELTKKLNEDEIIAKIGGRDNVGGACASQCLAYIANRKGYDVTDMKSYDCSKLFGNDDVWKVICKKYKGSFSFPKDEIKCAKDYFNNMKDRKEYVIGIGEHTSIVKKEDGVVKFLDIQSAHKSGYKELNQKKMTEFFTLSEDNNKNKAYLLCIDTLNVDDDMMKIFGYINSNVARKKK